MALREITKRELVDKYASALTVGELKEFLNKHDLPDTAKVVVQRVEDVYYDELGWGVYLKEGEYSVRDETGNAIEDSLEQYSPAWCCVKYNDEDEDDILFIDLHY